jgi:uncharacterized protein YndB with AHSA1/START domain
VQLQIEPVGEREIVMRRGFRAPRARVFEAWTRPELVARWLGPRSWTMERCEIDLRVGGAWRYLMRGPEGGSMLMEGVFREVVAPERLVTTEAYDGGPNETLNTVTFAEREGRTTVTCRILFSSQELRDRRLKTNMARGAAEGFDRLEEMLATLQGGA